MTHGVVGVAGSIPVLLSSLTGRPFDDLGVIAQTSVEIAARIGATPTSVSVRGNAIPATGSVPLTMLDPLIINHTGPAFVLDGRPVQLAVAGQLNGVAGYLRREPGGGKTNDQVPIGDFSFTRLADGVETACPPGSGFVPDSAERYRASPLILRMGFNNRADFAQVWQDHRAVLAWSTAPRARILLLDPPITFYDDAVAKAQSERIAGWLRAQARMDGMMYFSVQGYVASTQALADAGVTPTPDDLAAIADRRTPMSATVGDGLHYSEAMNRAVAARLAQVLHDFGAI